VNRAVGRALRDYELQLLVLGENDRVLATTSAGKLETSRWIAGSTYSATNEATVKVLTPGEYRIAVRLWDAATNRAIALPLADAGPESSYVIDKITITP
jgi:hypothetical protein